ncbi:MAG: hypothetical protein D3925_00990 [Candidatus Electrothrix sp. AR5]|nr:hypothetical protein [Candidatus Electrothrix sp. AR5]
MSFLFHSSTLTNCISWSFRIHMLQACCQYPQFKEIHYTILPCRKIILLLIGCVLSLGVTLPPTLAHSSENWFIPQSITYENRLPVNHFRYKFTQEFADQYHEYAISQLSLLGELSKDQINEIETEYQLIKLILESVKAAVDINTLRSMTEKQIANFLKDPDFLQVILNQLDRMGLIPADEDDTVFKDTILLIAKLYLEILKNIPDDVPFTADTVKLTKDVNVSGSVTFWIGIASDIGGIANSIVHAVQLKKVTSVMYSHLIAHEFIKAHVCPTWEDKNSIFYQEGEPLSCDYQHYREFIASTYDDYADEYGGVGFPGVNAINSDGDLIKYSAGGTFKLYIKIPNKKGTSSLEEWYNSVDWTDYAILSPGNYDVDLATSVIEKYYGLNNATNYSMILLDGNERIIIHELWDDLRAGDEIKITTPFHNQLQREEILAYDFHYKVKNISIYKINSDLSEELITGKKYGLINVFKKVALKNGENIFKEEIELYAYGEDNPITVTRYFFINIPETFSWNLFLPAILAKSNSTNLQEGLVAHYEFEGNANDSSEKGNHGTEYGGFNYVSGKFGQAVQFTGDINQYIDVGKGLKYPFPMTVSAWVYFDNLPTATGNPIFLNDSVNGEAYYHGVYMSIGKEGRLTGWVGSGYAAPWTRKHKQSSNPVITEDNWHLVTVVFYNYDNMKLFADGAEMDGSFVGDGTGMTYSASYSGRIGNTNQTSEQYRVAADGLIDDLRVYNRALSQSEIEAIYLSE